MAAFLFLYLLLLFSLTDGTYVSSYVTAPESLSHWATQCITSEDNQSVIDRCAMWEEQESVNPFQFFADWTGDCFEKYCSSVRVRSDCDDINCDAMMIPTRESSCTGNNCRQFRLGWRMGSTWNTHVPRLVKITGTSSTTKWILLPFLGFQADQSWIEDPQSNIIGTEHMEADLWIEDPGTITNVTIYLDTDGTYSELNSWTYRFTPFYVQIAAVDGDHVTTAGYLYQAQGPSHCTGHGPGQCNEVAPSMVETTWKYYDLAGPAGCGDRGLCPDRDDHDKYDYTVPSWRERKAMVMTNAARNEALAFIERYGGYGDTPAIDRFQCSGFEETPYVAPYYFHLPATEGARIKARDLSQGICEGNSHVTCQETVDALGLPDTSYTARITAMASYVCVHPHVCPNTLLVNRPDVYIHGSGRLFVSGAGSAEGIGGALDLITSDGGHCGGVMNPEREMANVAYYPQATWTNADPLNSYVGGVFDYFNRGNSGLFFSLQPWNSRRFGSYMPFASGAHFVHTLEDGTLLLRFMVAYYDLDGSAPSTDVELVLDDTSYAMSLTLGLDWQGSYEYDMALSGSTQSCMSYYFRTSNSKGIFTLPQSGKRIYQTYGIGTCLSTFTDTTCPTSSSHSLSTACKASCGFAGLPCRNTVDADANPYTADSGDSGDSAKDEGGSSGLGAAVIFAIAVVAVLVVVLIVMLVVRFCVSPVTAGDAVVKKADVEMDAQQ